MYLEFDEDFPKHPKSGRLCASLQHPVAWAYMAKLWCWAKKYQKDGDLTAYEPGEIEFFVDWTLADGKFYAAAVRAGFIDEETDAAGKVVSRRLHNWMKRSGGAIKRMEDEATRKRLFRLHSQKRCDHLSCPHCAASTDGDAHGDGRSETEGAASGGRPADGADQDKTKQGKSKQDHDLSLGSRSDLSQTRAKSEPRAIALKDGPLTGHELRRVFSLVRERDLPGSLAWVTPAVAGGKDSTMAEVVNDNPEARVDVIPTMAMLFRLAKEGKAGDKSQEILDDGSFAFGTWCSKWTSLRERLHGKTTRASAVPQPGAPALPKTVDLRR